MRISAKTQYACIAMSELAAGFPQGEPVRIRAIADEHNIPQKFLVQILLQLKAAGLVNSTRGAAGGYQLSRPPSNVSLAEIISAVCPSEVCPSGEDADSKVADALTVIWSEVAAAEQELLAGITLADVLDRAKEAAADPMYYI